MKKIIALVAVLFSVVIPVQSQATPVEKIVIIDNAFNLAQISGSVEFVCVASESLRAHYMVSRREGFASRPFG